MIFGKQFVIALGALLATAACDGRTPGTPGNLPTRAPRGSVDPGLPPIYAEIGLRSLSAEAGSTLWLRACDDPEGAPGDSAYCTGDLEVVFELTADRDLRSVALRLNFMQEGRRCASAETPGLPLSGHAPTQVGASLIYYLVRSGEHAGRPESGCAPPPVSTTTLMAELVDYSQSDAGESVMTWSFPIAYTFAVRPGSTN
jgi:hypothetical protein